MGIEEVKQEEEQIRDPITILAQCTVKQLGICSESRACVSVLASMCRELRYKEPDYDKIVADIYK